MQLAFLLLLAMPLASLGSSGSARTPPMGWMSWAQFGCITDCAKKPDGCINDKLYMRMTDALASEGYLELGYNTVHIDDCWPEKERNAQGELVGDKTRFPNGMKALGDYMHSKGVKYGIYSDVGTKTCGGYPGSNGHFDIDSKTFASWGVDYLKMDGCYDSHTGYTKDYPSCGQAIATCGRNITYSCSWPAYLGSDENTKPWKEILAAGCNLWRNWDDISCRWSSVEGIIDHWGNYSKVLASVAGPGHWNDPDQLVIGASGCYVGGDGLSVAEAQSQLSIWSIMAGPLIMSNDLAKVPSDLKAVLQNKEVIAVNQDPAGHEGSRLVSNSDGTDIWARQLSGGDMVVGLLNRGESTSSIAFTFQQVGWSATSANLRDLWSHTNLGSKKGGYKATVTAHGIRLFRLTKG